MKKKNIGLIITTAIIALVVVATLGVAIFAGVVAIFSDNGGEETTAPKTEQTTTAGEGGSTETEGTGGTTNNGETTAPTETTTAAEEFDQSESIVFPEITESDD